MMVKTPATRRVFPSSQNQQNLSPSPIAFDKLPLSNSASHDPAAELKPHLHKNSHLQQINYHRQQDPPLPNERDWLFLNFKSKALDNEFMEFIFQRERASMMVIIFCMRCVF